jgi:hypothetical protein
LAEREWGYSDLVHQQGIQTMRLSILHPRSAALAASLLALSLGAGAAVAQTPAPPPAAATDAAPNPRPPHMTLKDRFTRANTTNDGRLTLDQAQGNMPMVARNFPAIDKDNKGYVTISDIQTFMREQRAMRRQTAPNTNG